MAPNTHLHPNGATDGSDDVADRLAQHDNHPSGLQSFVDALLAGQAAILSRLEALEPHTPPAAANRVCLLHRRDIHSWDAAAFSGHPTRPTSAAPAPPITATGRSALALDVPSFSGMDPMGWIAHAEQFFDLNGTSPTDKVGAAVVGFVGSALHWARWLFQIQPVISWNEFKTGDDQSL